MICLTNKQLFKRLNYQLNRLIETRTMTSLSLLYIKRDNRYCYSLFINNENHIMLFHDYYDILDEDLIEKLEKLNQFIDEFLNKQIIRN